MDRRRSCKLAAVALSAGLAGALTGPVGAASAAPELATQDRPTLDRHTLDTTMETLDRASRPDPAEVTGWYVDEAHNEVVVRATRGAAESAAEWADNAGVDPATVTVETAGDRPRLFYNIVGGDPFYVEGLARCTIGFSIANPPGYVAAGHCGDEGDVTYGYNYVEQGVFQNSSFPGSDMAFVATNDMWVPQPWVGSGSGGVGQAVVKGSQEAPIGASVCRFGSTTGVHCGYIEAKNQTVNYPQGVVYGLTRTSVCAEPGDSGGPFLSRGQAQGITSGGSGNCRWGGTTYFQPINPVLHAYDLQLAVG